MTRKRSGISGDRAYKIQKLLIERVSDIYSSAISYKLTHEEIVEKLKVTVWNSKEASLAPSYVLAYVRGYCESKRNEIYRYWLVWLMMCGNELMTREELNEYGKESSESPWQKINLEMSRHVWKDKDGRILRDKPFDRKFLKCSDS